MRHVYALTAELNDAIISYFATKRNRQSNSYWAAPRLAVVIHGANWDNGTIPPPLSR